MIVRATEWMSGRWWIALAVVMSFILVARTGTVGAPAEARHSVRVDGAGRFVAEGAAMTTPTTGRELGYLALERHVRFLEEQVSLLDDALTRERARADILESSYRELEAHFDEITRSIRGLAEASAPLGAEDTQPMDAATVRKGESNAAPTKKSNR